MKFNVGREADADTNYTDASEIAGQARCGKLCVLHKIETALYPQRPRRNDVYVLCQQRALLRVGERTGGQDQQRQKEESSKS